MDTWNIKTGIDFDQNFIKAKIMDEDTWYKRCFFCIHMCRKSVDLVKFQLKRLAGLVNISAGHAILSDMTLGT